MNKLVYGLMAVFLLGFSTVAHASEKSISMYSGHSTGGLSTAFQTVIAKELENRGWDVDFKILGNCGKAKDLLENSDEPVLAGWGADWNIENNICNNPPSADSFAGTFIISPRLICGPYNDTSFTLQRGNKYVIGVNQGQNHDILLGDLGEKLGVDFKVVEYKNSGYIKRAMQAREINAWYTTKGLIEHNSNKQKCVYGTLTSPYNGIMPLNTLLSTDNVYSSFVGYLTMNDKFSASTRKMLLEDINNILTSKEYNDQLKNSGSFVEDVSIDKQIDFVNATSKAFVKK